MQHKIFISAVIALLLVLANAASTLAGSVNTYGKTMGNPDATVTMVMYSDLQCPFCARWHKTVYPVLKEKYIDTGLVWFEVKHFPLPFHDNAQNAAVAGECVARLNNKFFQYIDLLYNDQSDLSAEALEKHAVAVGANANTYRTCIAGSAAASSVNTDHENAINKEISGTPSFFINDVKIVGALPWEEFEPVIEEALSKSQTSTTISVPESPIESVEEVVPLTTQTHAGVLTEAPEPAKKRGLPGIYGFFWFLLQMF